MNINYEIGETCISESEMHRIGERLIEVLKEEKITYAVANAILNETQKLLTQKINETNLDSLN